MTTTSAELKTRVDVDPITFEVVRHRLESINTEQAVALKAVSGSPIVSEADDYNVGLYRADGQLVAMGRTVIYHASSMSEMVKHVLADCSVDPGINEGDSFVLNSPHKGALHAPDVGILQPIFHNGELIAWAGACSHQLDIGGMEHGGFMPQARDIYQEGLQIPPVKLVDGGRVRTDVWAMITGMSRLPAALNLNLRGLLAANRVGATELGKLIARYGVNTVLSVMDELLDLSERRIRARLRELPDGAFRARSYLDHDGHNNTLHRVNLEVTKTGDSLRFDFTGTDPEAGGFVNCTRTGLLAGVYAGALPLLAYDIPWNSGALRPIEIVCPDRTLLTCLPPAACSQGPLGGTWMAEITTTEAISKMLATHPDYIAEAQAAPAGGTDLFCPSGIDQYGDYSGWIALDAMQTGGGAYGHRDGLSPQGHRCISNCQVPNVEAQEMIMPLLWLYRRLIPDSGGPGRRQGGQSASAAMTLHHAHWLRAAVGGHGFESPTAAGIFGGYPARCNARVVVRDSDFWQHVERGRVPLEMSELSGTVELTAAKTPNFMLQAGDVFFWYPQAGGGWGDPLERNPQDVVDDVAKSVISMQTAQQIYGVVLAGRALDESATEARRTEIRAARKAWPAARALPGDAVEATVRPTLALLGDTLRLTGEIAAAFVTCACDRVLAPSDENWKDYAGVAAVEQDALGAAIRLHHDLQARMYACPGCGRLLEVEVSRRGDEPLYGTQLELGTVGVLAEVLPSHTNSGS
ncbi:hydantoinase B/oxoprolinase family protein [Micromonospora sp. LZ34]